MRTSLKSWRVLGAALAASLAATGAARADVLYENPDSGFGLNHTPIWFDGTHPYFGSNAFTLDTQSVVTGVYFAAWTSPGDQIKTIDWAIVDQSGPPLILGKGTVAVASAFKLLNFYNADVTDNTFSTGDVKLGAGTYWLYLSDAVTADGAWASWDITSNGTSAFGNNSSRTQGNTFRILGEEMVRDPGVGGNPCNTNLPLGCGGAPGAVPEPDTWALMIFGFGLAGSALRKRRATRPHLT